ncbi:hypothetical protein BLFGPEAP_01830 [Candidatus Methanoperedenaceae archaeon GB50]|mgnify:FL=1|nr:MAG: hypothetical protein KCCBMMGE_00289 [Candidatus Methanoperedenaceae archaeon GB37]CAD7777967.1 hypothetical protein BLFGPEAP_01830 [Candidatus Methanoperedenaceae archaeon GB50]CAD7779035.1 hypothetical protein DMNBHIDG_01939 [Candidatus Methanoperedenaceae archaeon GB37]
MEGDISRLEQKLSPSDRNLLRKFINNLLKKEKYTQLRKEIEDRRREVERGEYLTHEEFWEDI